LTISNAGSLRVMVLMTAIDALTLICLFTWLRKDARRTVLVIADNLTVPKARDVRVGGGASGCDRAALLAFVLARA
jgi:hypothetical protein